MLQVYRYGMLTTDENSFHPKLQKGEGMKWEINTQIPMETICYTDGFKLRDRMGLGSYIEEPKTKLCLGLSEHNTCSSEGKCNKWM